MQAKKPNDGPVYDAIDLTIAASFILLILYAVGYHLSHYQQVYGHLPY